MSVEFEHRGSVEALGAYLLGALPDDERGRVERHLESCEECRNELQRLSPAIHALAASPDPIEAPPALRQRVMAVVEDEAQLLRAASLPNRADQPVRPARRARLTRALSRPVLALGAAGLVAASALAVAVVGTTGGDSGGRTIQARIADPARSHGVRASLRVTGDRGQLLVAGLPRPAGSHVYELWVQRAGARPVPAGTFLLQSGSVPVAGSLHRAQRVMVTDEPRSGSAVPTTAPLVIATLS